MKIFVQNPNNRFYMDENGQWTPQSEGALSFKSIAEATELCRTNQLDHYQLVLKFHCPDFELLLPRNEAERMATPTPTWIEHAE